MSHFLDKLLKFLGHPAVNLVVTVSIAIPVIIYKVILHKMELHIYDIVIALTIGIFLAFAIYVLKRLKKLEEDRDILDFLNSYRGGYAYGVSPMTRPHQISPSQIWKVPIPFEELIDGEKTALRNYLLKKWNKTGNEIDSMLDTMYNPANFGQL